MSKAKLRSADTEGAIGETDELSDLVALEHSRSKYARVERIAEAVAEEGGLVGGTVAEARHPDREYESKHTLDSDEEEDIKYEKLDINEVEGQVESGEEYDGETKLTAFNMNEDLEDGHFDADGNFIFDKKKEEIKDAWLDNVDWSNVKSKAGEQWHRIDESESEEPLKTMNDDELKDVYARIAAMLRENETIEKALKRLGKSKGISEAEERKRRWAAKKAGNEYVSESTAIVKELTGLADSLVCIGEMEAYQYTQEKLNHLVREIERKKADEFDMFADEVPTTSTKGNVEGKEDVKATAKDGDSVVPDGKTGGEEVKKGEEVEDEEEDFVVKWEYRLEESETAEVIGPVTSEQMLKMKEDGRFDAGGWARKFGTKAFYSIARLDFELYT